MSLVPARAQAYRVGQKSEAGANHKEFLSWYKLQI